MQKHHLTRALSGIAAALTTVVLACASPDGGTTAPTANVNLAGTGRSWLGNEIPGFIRVCKVAGPAGVYTFTTSVVGGGDFLYDMDANLPTVSLDFDGETAICAPVYGVILNDSWDVGETAQVTITENLPSGVVAQDITVNNLNLQFPGFVFSVQNTNTVTVTMGALDRYKISFTNGDAPPPPPGGEGCTPGYWKAQQHWDSWATTGYTPAQLISTVFNVPAGLTKNGIHLGAYSMVAGLGFQGGSTLSGKAEILLRAGIAGVLNAGSDALTYGMTSAQVIAAVNAALASGDLNAMTTLAGQIDLANNAGCVLN